VAAKFVPESKPRPKSSVEMVLLPRDDAKQEFAVSEQDVVKLVECVLE
jgi:hypothetical protein